MRGWENILQFKSSCQLRIVIIKLHAADETWENPRTPSSPLLTGAEGRGHTKGEDGSKHVKCEDQESGEKKALEESKKSKEAERQKEFKKALDQTENK